MDEIKSGKQYIIDNCGYYNWKSYFPFFAKIANNRQEVRNNWLTKNKFHYSEIKSEDWLILCVVQNEVFNQESEYVGELVLRLVDFPNATVITDSKYEYKKLYKTEEATFFKKYKKGDIVIGFEYYRGFPKIDFISPIMCANEEENRNGLLLKIRNLKSCYNNTLSPFESHYPDLLKLRDEYADYKVYREEQKKQGKEEEIHKLKDQCAKLDEQLNKIDEDNNLLLERIQHAKEHINTNTEIFDEKNQEFKKLEEGIESILSKLATIKEEHEEKNIELDEANQQYNEVKRKLEGLEKRIGDVKNNYQDLKDTYVRCGSAKRELLKLELEINDKKKHELIKAVEKLNDYGLGFLQDNELDAMEENTMYWEGKSKQELIEHIKRCAIERSEPFYYGDRVIESFVWSMFTNQLIILYGPTGTGKTSLPQIVSEAVGGKCQIISVQSNWNDDQDLLGFYNVVQKKYIPTKFLDTIIEAKNNANKLYFVVLDEMNLAQVEYYFAKILSAMETEDKSIDLFSTREVENTRERILFKIENLFKKYMKEDDKKRISDASGLSEGRKLEVIREILSEKNYNDEDIEVYFKLLEEWNNLNTYPARIEIPENVQFVGTINMDASTKNISPKVIDRGFLIELTDGDSQAKDASMERDAVDETTKERDKTVVSMDVLKKIINTNNVGNTYSNNCRMVKTYIDNFIKKFNEACKSDSDSDNDSDSSIKLRMSKRCSARIEKMLEGMSELSGGKSSADVSSQGEAEDDLFAGMDDETTDDTGISSETVDEVEEVASDFIVGKILSSISEADVNKTQKGNIMNELTGYSKHILHKLDAMYDEDFGRFNYWR